RAGHAHDREAAGTRPGRRLQGLRALRGHGEGRAGPLGAGPHRGDAAPALELAGLAGLRVAHVHARSDRGDQGARRPGARAGLRAHRGRVHHRTRVRPTMAEQRWSQASQRKNEIMLDQHGRQYATVIEIRTGHPITISPLFRAPLMPPDKFIRMRRPGEQAPGWANPYCKLVVDYDAWAAELEQTHAAYERKKQQLATRIG